MKSVDTEKPINPIAPLASAGWYPLAEENHILRWWTGSVWDERFAPNPQMNQPNLPRFIPEGAPIGKVVPIAGPAGGEAKPGWFAKGNAIRWWDGVQWANLSYPKRYGVNWGGGSRETYAAVGYIAAAIALVSFFFAVLAGVNFIALALALVAFGSALITLVLFYNASQVEKLKLSINQWLEDAALHRGKVDDLRDPMGEILLNFGLDSTGESALVDMRQAGHCLLVGDSRSGMPSMLRNLSWQVKRDVHTELIYNSSFPPALDAGFESILGKKPKMTNPTESFKILEKLERLMENRLESLLGMATEKRYEKQKEFSLIVFAQETISLFSKAEERQLLPEFSQRLSRILERGSEANIFIILSIPQRYWIEKDWFKPEQFGIRAALGVNEPEVFKDLFGSTSNGKGKRSFGVLQVGAEAPKEFTRGVINHRH